jgi:hypothetical protein
MRLGGPIFVLLVLAAISTAQDTNFPVGPQYLIISGSPLFLRPIATPTLSLSATLASPSGFATELEAAPETPPQSSALPSQRDLSSIFWGENAAQNVSESAIGKVSEIEITSAQPPRLLPASMVEVGVTGMTDAQSVGDPGYGMTLGESAAYWKAQKPHAPRVYTNVDVQRLHPN